MSLNLTLIIRILVALLIILVGENRDMKRKVKMHFRPVVRVVLIKIGCPKLKLNLKLTLF